ncbi:riboflavin transporter FmnP [Bacillus methanolicus]|uniref:ECF transporter S component n=1 Tax=Bacillus methanolicus TaxID=1471 RepID=UPI00238002E1|nr:ECF transporter S component [Bacillus methanolicus]MDE3839439.1 riboflavin transporter FmnP [Bacillus methanolicus]
MKKLNTKTLVTVGMLSTIAYVLMLLNFPIPPFPSFLLIDFSDIPALIAALVFGPAAGILVELIKNILDYLMKGSPTGVPVGHIANFAAGIIFILPTWFVYNKLKTKKGMTIALVTGTFVMAVLMSILNYFFILPAYTFFLNAPAMSAPETRQLIVTAILPFNIVKGLLLSIVFMLIFSRLQSWIGKQKVYESA